MTRATFPRRFESPSLKEEDVRMYVAARPIAAPVALIEKRTERGLLRVLVFREGLLAPPIIALLARLLQSV